MNLHLRVNITVADDEDHTAMTGMETRTRIVIIVVGRVVAAAVQREAMATTTIDQHQTHLHLQQPQSYIQIGNAC